MIAQGVWMTQFGGKLPDGTEAPDAETGRPIVLWHSKMLESGDFVTAESFDHWRFECRSRTSCWTPSSSSHDYSNS